MNRQRTPRDDAAVRFDDAMRALHQNSLARLTPRVRWQLKPARPAPKGGVAGWFGIQRMGPLWAGGTAAVMAVAVGLGLWRSADPVGPTATTVQVVTQVNADETAPMLGEDPDFYAWLASDDADLVAME